MMDYNLEMEDEINSFFPKVAFCQIFFFRATEIKLEVVGSGDQNLCFSGKHFMS